MIPLYSIAIRYHPRCFPSSLYDIVRDLPDRIDRCRDPSIRALDWTPLRFEPVHGGQPPVVSRQTIGNGVEYCSFSPAPLIARLKGDEVSGYHRTL